MITIFFSCLNEETRGPETLETIHDALKDSNKSYEVIAVDDGSTDDTYRLLLKKCKELDLLAKVVKNEKNLGIGESLKKALSVSRGEKFLLIAGDNDAPSDLIRDLVELSDEADLILTFWLNKEMRGRFRNLISTIYNSTYMIFFGVHVAYLNGPTVWNTDMIKRFEIISSRFSIAAELSVKCLRSGASYIDFPSYMVTGLAGSSSIKFGNLIEVMTTFVKVFFEIRFTDSQKFSKRPRRVSPKIILSI
jgi:glycosyltransferase involved in cell wall biosynthesis